MKTGAKYEIEHDLNFYYYGQGGLLDILYQTAMSMLVIQKIERMDTLQHPWLEEYMTKKE